MSYNRRLVGYAFLKAELDAGNRDIRSILAPLVRRALLTFKGVVSPNDLAVETSRFWDMDVPVNVVRFVMPVLEKEGVLTRMGRGYTANLTAAQIEQVKRDENAAHALVSRVTAALAQIIIREIGPNTYGADEILYSFLDESGIGMFADGSGPRVQDLKKGNAAISVVATYLGYDPSCNEFRNTAALDDLTRLVEGDVLYRAATAISEGETSTSMQGVDVYMDTSLLFRVLGHFGPSYKIPTFELVQLARQLGCRLKTFEHCVVELEDGLKSIAERLHAGGDGRGMAYEHAIQEALGYSDLMEAAELARSQLDLLGIQVENLPPRTIELNIDESRLDYQVESHVDNSPNARKNDVDAIAAIYRFRGGEVFDKLEGSKAIFITPNVSLARAATAYFKEHFRLEAKRNVVQHCMTDVVFTTLLWAKAPTQFSGLPRKRMIAHALANLRPSEAVLRAFKEALAKMTSRGEIGEQDALRLRHSAVCRAALVVRFGANEDVSEGCVRDILRRYEEDQRDERDRAVKSAVAASKKQFQTDLATATLAAENHKKSADEAARKVAELSGTIDAVTGEKDSLLQGIDARAAYLADRAALIAVLALGLIAVPLVGLGIFGLNCKIWTPACVTAEWFPVAEALGNLMLAGMTVFGVGFGLAAAFVRARIRSYLFGPIKRMISPV